MIDNLVKEISSILADYENNRITPEHIIRWVNQFDEGDRAFILSELDLVFRKTYVTKNECKLFLKGVVDRLAQEYGYASGKHFLTNTVILDLQKEEKSQKELLELLDEILRNNYGIGLEDCGKNTSHYLYLDDILATGNTLFTNLSEWFSDKNIENSTLTNYEYLRQKDIKINLCFLCLHSWGAGNVEYRLMMKFDDKIKKHIKFFRSYEVENNSKAHGAKLNAMIPVEEQSNEIKNYLNSLEADKFEDRAFRKLSQPVTEILFSSAPNRLRLENIFLTKGIEILSLVRSLTVKQIRPLGYTVRSHKTFGLGTMFFTYRNIPNNCPIVFWWKSNNWDPLFVLKNRGK